MLRVTVGVFIGIAASLVGISLYHASDNRPAPTPADRRLAAERVVAAVRTPSDGAKRALRTTCTATYWSVCLVTVYVPAPTDACQDWMISVHDHFATGPRYLQTRVCS
jgi:hypothetical protein